MTTAPETYRGGTITERLTRTSVIVAVTALLLASSGFVFYFVLTARRTITRELQVQAGTIAYTATPALVFNDDQAARQALNALAADRNVVSAAIYGDDGRLFASYDAHAAGAPALLTAVDLHIPEGVRLAGRTAYVDRAIVSNGARIGVVRIVYSLRELGGDLERFLAITAVVLVLAVVGALVATRRVQGVLSRPIGGLAQVAVAVSRSNDYSLRVPVDHTIGELGILIDTFNQMLSQIQIRDGELDAAAQRYQALNEQLERRVVERTAELQAINKELEAFTYSVSHDLRAPLRRIDGFSGMLADKFRSELGDEGAHFLTRIRDGTRTMGRLIDDLLNLARLGRKDVALRPTDLSAAVRRVIDGLAREYEGRVVRWHVEPLPVVEADPALIDVVLTNLLSNAVKYTRPRAEATIAIGCLQTPGEPPVVFVRDNGVGFNIKYADKLFGAFQRLHRADEFEGTGIGLATVQRIVHKHNGTIWVDAELDRGATFYFSIGGTPVVRPVPSQGALPA